MTECYEGLLDALVIDGPTRRPKRTSSVVVTDTLMSDRDAARRLARRPWRLHGGA